MIKCLVSAVAEWQTCMEEQWNNFVRGKPKSSDTILSQYNLILHKSIMGCSETQFGLHCEKMLTKSSRYDLTMFYGV